MHKWPKLNTKKLPSVVGIEKCTAVFKWMKAHNGDVNWYGILYHYQRHLYQHKIVLLV